MPSYITGGGYSPNLTDGAAHVSIRDTSVPVRAFGAGGEASFTATNPSTIVLGDLTPFGIPLGSLTFTDASVSTADLTWTAADGKLMFQISNASGALVITLSGTTPDGDVFDGPLPVLAAGAYSVANITANGVYFLYLG